jgi:hypothetical protein
VFDWNMFVNDLRDLTFKVIITIAIQYLHFQFGPTGGIQIVLHKRQKEFKYR